MPLTSFTWAQKFLHRPIIHSWYWFLISSLFPSWLSLAKFKCYPSELIDGNGKPGKPFKNHTDSLSDSGPRATKTKIESCSKLFIEVFWFLLILYWNTLWEIHTQQLWIVVAVSVRVEVNDENPRLFRLLTERFQVNHRNPRTTVGSRIASEINLAQACRRFGRRPPSSYNEHSGCST